MSDGVAMEYSSEGARTGGRRAGSAGEVAETAVGHLARAVIGGSLFGAVEVGEALVGGLGSTRDGYARMGHDVAAAHHRLDGDAHTVAALGDELDVTAGHVAEKSTPPPGMTG